MRIHEKKKISLNKISALGLVTYKFTEVHHSKPYNLKAPQIVSVARRRGGGQEERKNKSKLNDGNN